MHETRTNLQRKAANAARAKSERRPVADELKELLNTGLQLERDL